MIDLQVVHHLAMRAPREAGRPAHVAAASGLVATRTRLYVVADDELHLAAFARDDGERGDWIRLLDGELPLAHAERKAAKPDFEALLRLPPRASAPHGTLLALGSGSRATRRLGVALALDVDGVVAGAPWRADLAGLHAVLQAALGEVNIEGALVRGDELVLLQRGSRRQPRNLLVHLALKDLLAVIDDAQAAPRFDIRALHDVALGEADGVALAFTDASLLGDGRIVITAVAEDSSDSYADGPCAAAAIGVLDAQGVLQRLERVAPTLKLEGVHAALGADGIELLLVSDADDAAIASTLCRAVLPLR